MIAAGVLALLVLVALVIRSRGSKPDEMEITALAGEADDAAADADQASHEGRIPEGGFAVGADSARGFIIRRRLRIRRS